jgi:hypothetical protein
VRFEPLGDVYASYDAPGLLVITTSSSPMDSLARKLIAALDEE